MNKTQILKKIAAKHGIEVIDLHVSQVDKTDMIGVPMLVTNKDIILDPSKPAYIVRTK